MINTENVILKLEVPGCVVRQHASERYGVQYRSVVVFSEDMQYRYILHRCWDSTLPTLNFIMLNPSTADEFKNDPTIERCEQRARRMGFGSITITNLFAFRSTSPHLLKSHHAPIGNPVNDDCIKFVAQGSQRVIVGWGSHPAISIGNRDEAVCEMLRREDIPAYALRTTSEGYPGHPLYIGYDKLPVAFNLPAAKIDFDWRVNHGAKEIE